jgi:hypothetical protein
VSLKLRQELLCRSRAAEVEALGAVAVELLEDGQGRGVFYAFGYHA